MFSRDSPALAIRSIASIGFWSEMTQRIQRCPLGPALLLSFLVLAGCGPGIVEDRGEVRGTVRLDGQPLDEGSIQFVPTGGNTGSPAWHLILRD